MANINKFLKTKRITILTCYDATFAKLLEETQCDAVLVGDSLGIVIKGEKNTRSVSMEEMIYHTKAVRQGIKKKPIITDMPINSYKDKKMALNNAKKLIKAGADIVKLEGDKKIYDVVSFLTSKNIKVCAHIGYTPQSTKKNLKIKNQTEFLAKAKSLEVCGACMIILSKTGPEIDKLITKNLLIPTISFRSSNNCKGIVEIIYDVLGLTPNFTLEKNNLKKTTTKPIKKLINNYIKETHKL